jgi:hypothetical protein
MADLQACTLLCTLLCLPTLTAFLYQLPIDHTLKLQPYEPACPRARPPEPFYTDHILILPFSYQILRWQSCKPACPVHALLCLLTPVTFSYHPFLTNILRWQSCKLACPVHTLLSLLTPITFSSNLFLTKILRWRSCKPACPVHALLSLLTPITFSYYLFLTNILRWRSCEPARPRTRPPEPP